MSGSTGVFRPPGSIVRAWTVAAAAPFPSG